LYDDAWCGACASARLVGVGLAWEICFTALTFLLSIAMTLERVILAAVASQAPSISIDANFDPLANRATTNH
jgi:hypothetical protein